MKAKTALEKFWHAFLALLPCVLCTRGHQGGGRVQHHHVAEGSGRRSHFACVRLCSCHHDEERRGTGFHGMGTERFCKIFRVPGESEYGLLVWQMEDIARALRAKFGDFW